MSRRARGGRGALALAAVVALVVGLAVGGVLGPGGAPASAGASAHVAAAGASATRPPALPAAGDHSTVDYASGPYAGRLCGAGAGGDGLCVLGRVVAAAAQGARLRADAVADGKTCEVQGGLWVCFGIESLLAQRGGTTYGDVFLTPRERTDLDPALLAHEREHVRQWRLFGPDFALLYLLAGTDPCTNTFEIAAGLDAGGYSCP